MAKRTSTQESSTLSMRSARHSQIHFYMLADIGVRLNDGESIKSIALSYGTNAGALTGFFKWRGYDLSHYRRDTDHVKTNANALLSRYKTKADMRGYSFQLTDEQFLALTQQDCNYCGRQPSQKSISEFSKDHPYIYNGVDRQDSTKGYTADNCVPCCKWCNTIKMDMSIDDFYGTVARIHEKKMRGACG